VISEEKHADRQQDSQKLLSVLQKKRERQGDKPKSVLDSYLDSHKLPYQREKRNVDHLNVADKEIYRKHSPTAI